MAPGGASARAAVPVAELTEVDMRRAAILLGILGIVLLSFEPVKAGNYPAPRSTS